MTRKKIFGVPLMLIALVAAGFIFKKPLLNLFSKLKSGFKSAASDEPPIGDA